jgi:translation elongation factor EF-Tu-like GTPase
MTQPTPDVIANIRLFSKGEGGREGPTRSDNFGCLFEYNGENFDCRLLLDRVGPIAPGQHATVEVKFLRPELIKPRLQVGSRFSLREGKTIGEGVVESIVQNSAVAS